MPPVPVPRHCRPLQAYKEICGSPLLPDRCVVYVGRTAAFFDRMLWQRPTWVRIRMVTKIHGRRTVARQRKADGGRGKVKEKAKGGGHTLNGIKNRAFRHTCYWRNGARHLLPKWPSRNMPKGDSAKLPLSLRRGNRPPYSSISKGSLGHARKRESSTQEDLGSSFGQSLPITLDLGGRFFVTDADSVVVINGVRVVSSALRIGASIA